LLGISFGVCAPSNADGSITIIRMSLNSNKVIREGSSAANNHTVVDWLALGIGGIGGFHSFALLLMWGIGRAIGLGNGAGVMYSAIADGQRLASVMVIGLLAVYVEFWVAMGFAAFCTGFVLCLY